MKNNSRYPYTYAADFIRGLAGYDKEGTKLSRSDASQIRQGISDALGIDDKILAEKIAEYYIANEESITKNSVDKFIAKATGE